MVGFLAAGIVLWLLAHVADAVQLLWNLLSKTVFTTPDTTLFPQVQALAGNSLTIVNGCFVLAIVAAGVIVMTQHTVQSRYGVNELLPRLVLGFVAANFALPICHQLVRLGNSVTQAVTGQQFDATGAFTRLMQILHGSMTNPEEPFLVLCLGLMIAGLTGMLLVAYMTRIGILIVLVGLSPLALACHASPFTDPVAKLWWRSFGGLLATVTLQALALHITMVIFFDPQANLAATGIPTDPTGIFNLFIIACLLWATIKIPSLMRKFVTKAGGGPNPAGLLIRMVVMQQLTGLLRLPLRGAGKGAAALAGRSAGRAATASPNAATTTIPYWKPRMPRPTARRPAASSGRPGDTRLPVPAGVNPATAMPKTRPAWMGGTPPRAGSTPVVPAGVNPATAMPKTRPAWQGGTAGNPPPAAARPTVPGANPGAAMPKVRPAWQNRRPRPGGGGNPPPRSRP